MEKLKNKPNLKLFKLNLINNEKLDELFNLNIKNFNNKNKEKHKKN